MQPQNQQFQPTQNSSPQTNGVAPGQQNQSIPPLDVQAAQVAQAEVEAANTDKKSKVNKDSTQDSLQIAEVRDGLVILIDGTYRAVILVQSINFDLMSSSEKEGVESSYQQFLNSLYFPIQIMIRSYRVNLKTYMSRLNNLYEKQDNVLLSLLMEDYINYIDYLISNSNIMEKQFYIVVPYVPGAILGDPLNSRKLSDSVKRKKATTLKIDENNFNKAKTELRLRVGGVLDALKQMGIGSIPLNTQELIELYYNFYNPDTATVQSMVGHEQLEEEFITKGKGMAPRPDLGDF